MRVMDSMGATELRENDFDAPSFKINAYRELGDASESIYEA